MLPDLHVFLNLLNDFSPDSNLSTQLEGVWKQMGKPRASVLRGITFTELKKGAVQLDDDKWKNLPFVEQKALHFEPSTLVAAKK